MSRKDEKEGKGAKERKRNALSLEDEPVPEPPMAHPAVSTSRTHVDHSPSAPPPPASAPKPRPSDPYAAVVREHASTLAKMSNEGRLRVFREKFKQWGLTSMDYRLVEAALRTAGIK